MSHRRLVALALGLAAAAASSASHAQERLHLDTFGDEALHRITLPYQGEPIAYNLDGTLGADADIARGAAPTPAWPFALTEDVGFGLRHGVTDDLQLRVNTVVPLPVAPIGKAGKWSTWDLELADRLHADLGLGGIARDGSLKKDRGGADLSLDGGLFQAGKYSTSFVRQDIGPFPFLEGMGRFTVTPRLNLDKDTGLVLPLAAELHAVDVDRPRDEFSYVSKRLTAGVGIKPYVKDFSNGMLELAGAGWEVVSFTPGKGAPLPKLGGVERFDLRLLHADAVTFSVDNHVAAAISGNLGANWLHDPSGSAHLSTFAGNLSVAVHRSPDDDLSKSQLGGGFGVTYDGAFLADGSALSRRARFEGFLEGFAMEGRFGGSVRAATERMVDAPDPNPFRGAVAAEWYVAPVKVLQLGADFTSTQQCVSSATAAGPAWCHRFGAFLRLAVHVFDHDHAAHAHDSEDPPPPPPPPELPVAPEPQVRVQQVAQ
jgi:hypothetical protein